MLFWGQALSKITSTGAMTYCFIRAIERGHGTTYGSILNSMRTAIRGTGNDVGGGGGGGVVTSLLTMLLSGGSVVSGGLVQVYVCYTRCLLLDFMKFVKVLEVVALGIFFLKREHFSLLLSKH